MRSQLARIEKGVAATAATVTFLVDLDGQTPVTLYLENLDQKAALIMRTGGDAAGSATPAVRSEAFVSHGGSGTWPMSSGTGSGGSKNGCLKFEAVAVGAGGNNNTIEITAAANQAFSIVDLGSDDYQINLRCGADGRPNQRAYEVLIAIANEVSAGATAYRAAINTTLAPGSDGSAVMEPRGDDATHVIPASTDLNGGSAATATGTATVSVSPQPTSESGAYVAVAAAGTALSAVAANTVKVTTLSGSFVGAVDSYPVPLLCKGLKVVIVGGVAGSWIVLTVVASPRP